MENILLVGIGEGAPEIVREAIDEYDKAPDVEISDIVFDSKELGDTLFANRFRVKSLDILGSLFYDRIIICANGKLALELEKVFRQKLGLNAHQCQSFLKPRTNGYNIDWDNVYENKDIYGQISKRNSLNDLENFFMNKNHRLTRKWAHYLDIYNRHLEKYRGKSPVIMEIGVYKGGSLQMWKNYFGPGSKVIGIDIDEETKNFEEDQISVEIGSQEDRDFLRRMKEKYPHIDILVDDGGHTMNQQIVTFEEMFPHLSEGGCYMCEDLHTSYWKRYGGGYKKPDTYIEYSKNLIDYINAWHSEEECFQENKYTRMIEGLHYYTSMLVIEKARVGIPVEWIIG